MGYKTVPIESKRNYIEKVETLANETGISIHAASAKIGGGKPQKYYQYKKSLGLAKVTERPEVVHIHPMESKQYTKRKRGPYNTTRSVLVFGPISELARFAREVENAS